MTFGPFEDSKKSIFASYPGDERNNYLKHLYNIACISRILTRNISLRNTFRNVVVYFIEYHNHLKLELGAVHKLRKQARGEGGLAKCLYYYISLCSKLVYGGGKGVKNWQNLAYIVWMPPVAPYFCQ